MDLARKPWATRLEATASWRTPRGCLGETPTVVSFRRERHWRSMTAWPTAIVEYFVREKTCIAFVVRKDEQTPCVVRADLDTAALDEIAKEELLPVGAAKRFFAEQQARWTELMQPVVQPILEHTDEGEALCLVPHGVLHRLPIHAVSVEGVYLIERNAIAYAPSAAFLRDARRRGRGSSGGAVVVGDTLDDLQYARHEASSVAHLLGVEPLLGSAASKARVLAELASRERPQLLHLACHGKYDEDDALSSGILLAAPPGSASGRDAHGVLTAREIMSTDFVPSLVTLSACETAISQELSGDELAGMPRAWLLAGANAVVASLWAVDDLSTSFLMRCFYDALSSEGPAQALRSAQVRLMHASAADLQGLVPDRDSPLARALRSALASGRQGAHDDRASLSAPLTRSLSRLADASRSGEAPYASPYYWSAFTLVGDAS